MFSAPKPKSPLIGYEGNRKATLSAQSFNAMIRHLRNNGGDRAVSDYIAKITFYPDVARQLGISPNPANRVPVQQPQQAVDPNTASQLGTGYAPNIQSAGNIASLLTNNQPGRTGNVVGSNAAYQNQLGGALAAQGMNAPIYSLPYLNL